MESFKAFFASSPLSFSDKMKVLWYAANVKSAEWNWKSHFLVGGFANLLTIATLIMGLFKLNWYLITLSLTYNAISAFFTGYSASTVKKARDNTVLAGNRDSPEDMPKRELTWMTLANLGHWLLKLLQLTIAIKLFLAGVACMRNALREGRAATSRASDIGKAVMWVICIPLMFMFDFDTILNGLRGPLTYIGLYDSLSRIFNSKKDSEIAERELKLREEQLKLEKDKFEHSKTVNIADKTNAEALQRGSQAFNTDLDSLSKINSLLSSNEPAVVAAAYRELYKRTEPHKTEEERELLVQERMRRSSIYLGKTPAPRTVVNVEGSNNNNQGNAGNIDFVAGGVLYEKGEKQGFIKKYVDKITSPPRVLIGVIIGALLIVFIAIYCIFTIRRHKQQRKAVEDLFEQEAAAGTLIVVDKNNDEKEWWDTYKEDCILLYGSIPEVPPGADFSTENGYLYALATLLNTHKTDRYRLGELCNYKSREQVDTLKQLLAKHRQPINHTPVVEKEKPVKEVLVDVGCQTEPVAQKKKPLPPLPKVEAKVETVSPPPPPPSTPEVSAQEPVDKEAQVKSYACTCGKSFKTPRGRYNHRRRTGCAAHEGVSEKEGKKTKKTKGQNLKKAAAERGEDTKQKLSKERRIKQKLSKIEDERNRKFNTWRELKDSKQWADQDLAQQIQEELEELRRRAQDYEKDVYESATRELEHFLRRCEAAQLLHYFTEKEGVSQDARRDIPDIRVRCTVVTDIGEASTMAMPMANRLFLPLHFVEENCKDIKATIDSMVKVTVPSGLACPSFNLGRLKKISGFEDQCYVDYQVGGLTYAPVDSIGSVKPGDMILIRKYDGDTTGVVTKVDGVEAFNIRTETKGGDCNSLVYNLTTNKLVGLHNKFYPIARENSFLMLDQFPRRYFASKVVLGDQPALSEN